MATKLEINKKGSLGLFSLIMIAVVSVDSLRNLPVSAQYGFSLISFYVFAGLVFFLPLSWITAKLVAQYPITGGSYIWITKALGHRYGYLAMFIQWIYNMIWYPTIFAFITATFIALFFPAMQNNRQVILIASLLMFWGLSLIHCRGLRATSWFSTGSAIIGTLLPMIIMIFLAAYWLYTGNKSATEISWGALVPKPKDLKNIGFFSNVLFSLIGLEVIAMHAGNVRNPSKIYTKAICISSFIILFSIIFSSSALCVILPVEKLTLVDGLSDVLKMFFKAYSLQNFSFIIGFCIILGGLGIAASWMVGLARGLHASMHTMNAPAWLLKLNKNDMPSRVLFFQALVFSILMLIFLFSPNINKSYWILSAITAQFGLLYYILLFYSAFKLMRKNNFGVFNVAMTYFFPGIAITICIIGIIVGFIPPQISL